MKLPRYNLQSLLLFVFVIAFCIFWGDLASSLWQQESLPAKLLRAALRWVRSIPKINWPARRYGWQ